ncbi:TetR/AcrR family transcriptional regulator [Mesorhizobium sp. CCANP35]|uniref:TetR/AcrR family transcriptional regulator n=2 Tax=Mesorhizobium neociceri TaxID=1307853 RepID=A0A838BBX6_9HYPH|nr:TetR/AcrR family transcriptional regulator [Mesorhizobium neociceri]MBA1143587.1 TetR/AcrR family transcriptional regulator [Mesorhizobium neociceri]
MRVFWRNGYEATSMSDLVDALGINRASLYAAFGDKEALFLRVLDRYRQDFTERPVAALNEFEDPREAVGAFLYRTVDHLTDDRLPRGCLFANAILESPGGSERICQAVANGVAGLEDAIYHVLLRSSGTDKIPVGTDCRALARFFVGVAQGMALMAKVSPDKSLVLDIASTSMAIWPTAR